METEEEIIHGGEAPPPPTGSASPVRRSPTTVASSILVAILLALALAEGVLLLRGDPDEKARSEVLQTSQRFLVHLTTYNAETLEAHREEVLKLATGQFRREYTQLTGPDFLATLRERQADSKGRVAQLGVTSVKGDDAEAFALVEVTTKNKDLPDPKVERNLIELTLVRTSGGWRIASVTIAGRVG